MSLLAPAFLVGLAAIAIPVLIHLIQRERKRVVEFPSLMFLRRIPYQSVRRRRIRNWFLLLMRAAAVALIVAAFARPFFRGGAGAIGATGGAREVVVLLDQSASMGYGDHWRRAQEAARQTVGRLGGDDRGTLVLFSRNAEENIRATRDRATLRAAIDAARVGSGGTRYGPALKLAQSILARSPLVRREVVLISDFQKSGWESAEDVRFPDDTLVTPVSVADVRTANLAATSVAFARAIFSGQERITVTAALVNRSADPIAGVPVTLEINGHQIQAERVSIGGHQLASVSFAPFTLSAPNLKGTVRAGTDLLPQDNVFHFALSPSRPVSVLIVDQDEPARARRTPSLYLARALVIGNAPVVQVDVVSVSRLAPAQFDKRAVVIVNDVAVTAGTAALLRRFVEGGGGLLVVLGEHSAWPSADAPLLPGALGPVVDRINDRGASLGFLDYSHPIFELFKAPRSGDFSGARFVRYRSLTPGPADRILARFEDGAVAMAEKDRVIVWSSTLDDRWNDLALKPVFLPLVRQTIRHLARYEEPPAWYTVGQVLNTAKSIPQGSRDRRAEQVVLAPSGRRVPFDVDRPALVELNEQGFYEMRAAGGGESRPLTAAVNIDPAESDLSPMDPKELVAAVTGRATPERFRPPDATPATAEDLERRQAIWWYLLLGGLLLLAAETAVANRLSRQPAARM